jgi:dipeptidyl aminopeptidase/acylaminoacyl peptidase
MISYFHIKSLFMRIYVFLIVISCFCFNSSPAQKQGVKVTDMLNIKSASGITLNKEGSRAAFTLTSIEQDAENKLEYNYTNQIWTITTDGGAPRQLTSKENASQPAFSPDGKQLAFVRAVSGRPQIFLINLDGGEAVQLTKHRYGASNPKFSPDGKLILFSSSISLRDLLKDSVLNPAKSVPAWPFERPGFSSNEFLQPGSSKPDPDGDIASVRAYLDNNITDKKAKLINKLNFQDETDVSAEMNFNHFFLISLEGEKKPKAVTHGFFRFTSADFTPDGKQLILAGDLDSLRITETSWRRRENIQFAQTFAIR